MEILSHHTVFFVITVIQLQMQHEIVSIVYRFLRFQRTVKKSKKEKERKGNLE